MEAIYKHLEQRMVWCGNGGYILDSSLGLGLVASPPTSAASDQ